MGIIEGVLFEPVGCLAEFSANEFNEIAVSLFGQKKRSVKSSSSGYWQLLAAMQKSDKKLDASEKKTAEGLEIQAVEDAQVYEDVVPALSQLKAMGIKLVIASSLSEAAVNRFLEKSSLREYFSGVWNRDNAGGVMAAPLLMAIQGASFDPARVMALADTEEGLTVATEVGVNSILMINDYDDGRRLAMHPPTGGIVSLAELPDAITLIAEENKQPRS